MTANGSYVLYGVAGDIEVRVTRDGYQEQRKSLQVTGHQRLDFDLILSRPRDEIAGTYILAVTASNECQARLREEARKRTYTALVTQTGPRLTVTLQGATFYAERGRTFNSFSGIVEPHRVTFQPIEPFDYYIYFVYPDVLEQLTPTTWFFFGGSAATAVSRDGLSGTLNGAIGTSEGLPTSRSIVSCRSSEHGFTLSR